jgi:hypothetical protein
MPDYSGFLRIGKLVSVLVSVWTPEPPKPMLHTQLELEARVGIGRFTVYFLALKYIISPINARVFSLLLTFPNEPLTYPLTEGSTETFTEGFQRRLSKQNQGGHGV